MKFICAQSKAGGGQGKILKFIYNQDSNLLLLHPQKCGFHFKIQHAYSRCKHHVFIADIKKEKKNGRASFLSEYSLKVTYETSAYFSSSKLNNMVILGCKLVEKCGLYSK